MSKFIFDFNQDVCKKMSSIELSSLTGKNHADVRRDIENTLSNAEIDFSRFADVSKNHNNQKVKTYNLPRRECDLVISGYSVKYRLAVIDRWHELEANQIPQISHIDSLRLLADSLEQIEITKIKLMDAIESKAEIGSKREATAMNTASQATKRVKKLEVELDQSKDFYSVKRMQMLMHGQEFNWRILKEVGLDIGIEAIDVFDANYGTVKAYHIDVWKKAYAICKEQYLDNAL